MLARYKIYVSNTSILSDAIFTNLTDEGDNVQITREMDIINVISYITESYKWLFVTTERDSDPALNPTHIGNDALIQFHEFRAYGWYSFRLLLLA